MMERKHAKFSYPARSDSARQICHHLYGSRSDKIEVKRHWQLRELNRTKEQQRGGPSARAMLAQKGTRVLTHELKEELKRKTEVQRRRSVNSWIKSDRRRFLMKRF